MRELIYKRAAIDAMCDNCDTLNADCAHYPCSRYVAVEELPSAQQWIPCSERLPDEKDAGILKKLGINKKSDNVIATVDVNGARMTVTACTHDGKWDWNMKYAFPDFKVVAWMPLPKPYERKEE